MTRPTRTRTTRLMSAGTITLGERRGRARPGTARVQRGMLLLSLTGEELGGVAAVVENPANEVTDLILVRPTHRLEYRLVPVSLIDKVGGAAISLRLSKKNLASLAIHQPEP